jgi:1-pyrroline-5-carboxylate dehydrogenase
MMIQIKNNFHKHGGKMAIQIFQSHPVANEPVMGYGPSSKERKELEKELKRQLGMQVDVPLIIGGKEMKTSKIRPILCPHNHQHQLGQFHQADPEDIRTAAKTALKAKNKWAALPWEDRAAVFRKAADLLAGKYRYILNAATMLCQSKTAIQAEIDSGCELVDFWRFNANNMHQIYTEEHNFNLGAEWNRMEYRPLEGFVLAISPFNFTAIGGNLPTAPAMMGNVVIWKPASTAMLSSYYMMKILEEAGLPDGVINMVPGRGSEMAKYIIDHPDFTGVHFTGSTEVFNNIWKRVGDNLADGLYKTYPRLVGETGGKDFVIAYKDAPVRELSVALFRGAFEYQGQKCSAASRAYIPKSLWPDVQAELEKIASEISMGDITDFSHFMGAVIDDTAYSDIVNYIEHAKQTRNAEIIIGGNYDDSTGYFIEPTVIKTTDPKFKTMEEEIFGPVLTVFVYADNEFEQTLQLVDETSPYGLTGAVFAQDRYIVNLATAKLKNAAGNFYINDKPTGSVVGRQPFGGARMSGTNDKSGSFLNLIRWTSARSIKENFNPPKDYTYPHMV